MNDAKLKPKFRLRLLTSREWQQRQREEMRLRASQRREPSFVGWDKWDERMASFDKPVGHTETETDRERDAHIAEQDAVVSAGQQEGAA